MRVGAFNDFGSCRGLLCHRRGWTFEHYRWRRNDPGFQIIITRPFIETTCLGSLVFNGFRFVFYMLRNNLSSFTVKVEVHIKFLYELLSLFLSIHYYGNTFIKQFFLRSNLCRTVNLPRSIQLFFFTYYERSDGLDFLLLLLLLFGCRFRKFFRLIYS